MEGRLGECVARWVTTMGIDPHRAPSPAALAEAFDGLEPCRPGLPKRDIDSWERRHGYRLPPGLRAWLQLSNGFYQRHGPLIHPLSAIGPMVPFARVPGLVVQPESWFELGNPNVETVCIDLGYRWPGGSHPIFTSGDDHSASPPRVIAAGFDDWFLALLNHGGREYWFEPGFHDLGHPWPAHRAHAPAPPLPDRLRPLASRVRRLMHPGVDDRVVASELGISRGDVEALFRHLQHHPSQLHGR